MSKTLTILTCLLLTACQASVVQTDASTEVLPSSVSLDVPFSPQAPFADWDDPRQQEGCEEMSLIMVHHFLQGSELTLETALEELHAMSAWQTDRGWPLDIDLDDLAINAREYYGYEAEILENPTVENLQQALADGHPVIVPAAGRELGNPYFSGEGPWYHMLVLTGYTRWGKFITNDPGTRRGEGYKYKETVIHDAMHDWTGIKEEISTGAKRVLVVKAKNES